MMAGYAGTRRLLRALTPPALCALLLVGPGVARAQLGPSGGAAAPLFQGGHPNATSAKPPPAALPGAQGGKALAPAAADAAAMNPTEALFDAINRDDQAAARDALGRGADLRARDPLGMTPLQLSIDLGRNDITFLLLSMRDAAGPTAAVSGPAPAVAASLGTVGAKRAGPKAVARARSTAAMIGRPMPAPAPEIAGGGTPAPGAGFLGFDPSR